MGLITTESCERLINFYESQGIAVNYFEDSWLGRKLKLDKKEFFGISIGRKIFLANRKIKTELPFNTFALLLHEGIHTKNFIDTGLRFGLDYFSPQLPMGLLCIVLTVILLILNGFSILQLGLSIFYLGVSLAPWTANKRFRIELQAYIAELAVCQWLGKDDEDTIRQITRTLSGFRYWYMCVPIDAYCNLLHVATHLPKLDEVADPTGLLAEGKKLL